MLSKSQQYVEEVFLSIQKAIGLALLSAESEFIRQWNSLHKDFRCQNCYQLLGVDVIFDSNLSPKVIEINGEPSLKLTNSGKTHYDITKKNMAIDLIGIVYNSNSGTQAKSLGKDASIGLAGKLGKWAACAKERTKSGNVPITIDSAKYILDTFREHSRMGEFRPVYPNPALAEVYDRFLRVQRDREMKKSGSDPNAALNSHGSGERLRLHQLISSLQLDDALNIGGPMVMRRKIPPPKWIRKEVIGGSQVMSSAGSSSGPSSVIHSQKDQSHAKPVVSSSDGEDEGEDEAVAASDEDDMDAEEMSDD